MSRMSARARQPLSPQAQRRGACSDWGCELTRLKPAQLQALELPEQLARGGARGASVYAAAPRSRASANTSAD